MYYSRYIRNIYNNGVKLYLCGRPASPLLLWWSFGVNQGRYKMSAIYGPLGDLKEVRFSRG